MIGLAFDREALRGDLDVGPNGIRRDAGLVTLALMSLFTHRRALPDDALPPGSDRRGWIGDALAPVEDDRFGCRWWLLTREKQTEETRRRAIDYAREALAWLIEDGLATAVAVEAEWVALGILGISILITEASGAATPLDLQLRLETA